MRFVALVVGVGLIVGPAASAHRSLRSPLLHTTTGRISALGLSQVTVGRMTCSLTAKTEALAASFAVGENVSIDCLGKALKTMKLLPVTGGHALQPITITAPATHPPLGQFGEGTCTSHQDANGGTITTCFVRVG